MRIKTFTFNPFQENTYILYDETKDCVIIDPGCYEKFEKDELANFIETNHLKPVRLLNTHCHIDHVLGNYFVADRYQLKLEIHQGELQQLRATAVYGPTYGIFMEPSPEPSSFLNEGDAVKFGNTTLEIFFTPGHSPASICFYNRDEKKLIAGDVLFYQSIGRTDLPGGNHHQLLNSIREKLFVLPDDVIVYPGHGPETKIGFEKKYNPFLV